MRKCDEFIFCVAFITNGGVASLVSIFEELESRGIRGRIIASRYQNFTEPLALKRLASFTNIQLRVATETNMHSKGYLFREADTYTLIFGSSNLTQNALSKNYEWNLRITSTSKGALVESTLQEFNKIFDTAEIVDPEWIEQYTEIYRESRQNDRPWSVSDVDKVDMSEIHHPYKILHLDRVSPNTMQKEALKALDNLRGNGKSKALLISATGTGKTYLSAFDAKKMNPRRLLFVIHRENIARAAMKSFKSVFGDSKTMGVWSGSSAIANEDFVFSTIQMISKDENLLRFAKDYFDYIVIDEVHRAGASTYIRLMSYFQPGFLLGMTATPERMDGYDIFKAFDYNIAYEIRLQRALEEDMLCPFHYYGVTDVFVEETLIDEENAFLQLTSEERVRQILTKSEFYGSDDGQIRCLVFCNRTEVSQELATKFRARGYRAVALTGTSSESEREDAINRLETDDPFLKIDYIFTVDIFNEGVDIPRVNQIILLRPTQSAIVFVQQLGRGLRKRADKDYLTVIDFVGIYQNNYLVPIALFGDSQYNKDHLRKLMNGGSRYIPGASTVDFDKVSRQRIYDSITKASLLRRSDLLNDYRLLKFKIGRIPMMMDFINYGSRDPNQYVQHSRSYFNFIESCEEQFKGALDNTSRKVLELISVEIANGKRVEEAEALNCLVESGITDYNELNDIMGNRYGIELVQETFRSVIDNMNFKFVREKHESQLVCAGDKYKIETCVEESGVITTSEMFSQLLENTIFRGFLIDAIDCSRTTFLKEYSQEKYVNGFILYKKYSRKDAFRILCWSQNPVAQNVGGYVISNDRKNCAIFVNYIKEEGIPDTIKYEDQFISKQLFQWMSKANRTLHSPDINAIRENCATMRFPLFIKKHNDEGEEFYYMGDAKPLVDRFTQETLEIPNNPSRRVSIVRMILLLDHPVENELYDYLTSQMM